MSTESPLRQAARKALGGGLVGAGAMGANVVTLMWLRTTLFVQYAKGLSFPAALKYVYVDGGRGWRGLARFYAGVSYGLLLAPVSRFGDTAANAGVLSLFASSERHADAPMVLKTTAAGLAAGAFRSAIHPLDTAKTVIQVHGRTKGMDILRVKARELGWRRALFAGAAGAGTAHAVSFVPWFTVHNLLQARIPRVDISHKDGGMALYAARSLGIGLIASAVSDTASNGLHVLKTLKQVSASDISYLGAAQKALASGGLVKGLLLRGLGTRITASAINGALFTLLWNLGEDAMAAEGERTERERGENKNRTR